MNKNWKYAYLMEMILMIPIILFLLISSYKYDTFDMKFINICKLKRINQVETSLSTKFGN